MLTLLKKQLAQIASFLNLNDTEESLDRAVELSSAERMKNLENEQSREWAETKGTRQDKKFVRNARAGEWQSVLSQSSILAIETAWGPIMQNLGYELIVETAKRQAADKSEGFGL